MSEPLLFSNSCSDESLLIKFPIYTSKSYQFRTTVLKWQYQVLAKLLYLRGAAGSRRRRRCHRMHADARRLPALGKITRRFEPVGVRADYSRATDGDHNLIKGSTVQPGIFELVQACGRLSPAVQLLHPAREK